MMLCEKCGGEIMIENEGNGCAFRCSECGYVEKVIIA